MKIDQDTFKDGKLDYGGHYGEQRNIFWTWRWDLFVRLFEEKYPEMIVKFGSITTLKARIITRNITYLTFKYRQKLMYALTYSKMEHVSNSEFKIILNKFEKYLSHSTETERINRMERKPPKTKL